MAEPKNVWRHSLGNVSIAASVKLILPKLNQLSLCSNQSLNTIIMFRNKPRLKTLLTAVALATCTIAGAHTIAFAQGTPGLVIFGDRDTDVLNYYLDFGGVAENRDRYRLSRFWRSS